MVKISGPAIVPFSRCVLFIIFLQTIQAASNSSVSAIGVTSCDEFVTFPAASILICKLQRKRLRVKRNLEGELAWMNAFELLLAFNVLLGVLGLLIAFWP